MNVTNINSIDCQRMVIIDNSERTIISSLDGFNYSPAYNFSTSKTDKLLNDIDNYVEQVLAEEEYENVSEKVELFFKEVIKRDAIKHIVRDGDNLFKSECKKTMDKSEILTYRKQPRIYSSRELVIINNFNMIEFKKFFTNEISCLLNFIERFKSDDVIYYLPINIEPLRNTFVIDIVNTNEAKLDGELELIYQRVVIIYSTIFSNKFSSKKYRVGIFKELKFLKACLHYITFDMDRRLMRLKKYMKKFRYQYKKREIGLGTSRRLDDLLDLPPIHFLKLENEVSLHLKNLQI